MTKAPIPIQPVFDDRHELTDRLMRTAAELDNVRKLSDRRVADGIRRERHQMLCSFLEVSDNLERALDNITDDPAWRAGLKAVHDSMQKAFSDLGATSMDAIGQPFDPNLHDAVATAARPDLVEDTVAEVVQTGYLMADGSLLRPARVIVAKEA